MTISDLIIYLEGIRQQYGDVPVDGGLDCFSIERREYGGDVYLKVRGELVVEQG